MKRILLLVFYFLVAKIGYSQFPVIQYIGSDSTIVRSRGGLQGRFAPIPFTDTTQANTSRIRQYPGALIYTSGVDKYWYRNAATTGWVEFTSSGGATTNIYNSNGTLTSNRNLDGQGYNLSFHTLSKTWFQTDTLFLEMPGTNPLLLIDGLGSISDTSTYKPIVIDATGKVGKSSAWFGGGGGSGLPTKFDSSYTPLGGNRGSEYIVKSVRIRRNNITVTPTQIGDSAMYWNIDVPDTTSLSNRINQKADSSNVWFKTGNGGTDTTDFIGTNDVNPIIFKVNNLQAGFITARPDPTSAGSGSVTLGQYAGQTLRWNNGANTLIGHGAGAKIVFNPAKANQNTFVGLWAGYWTKYHSDPFGGRSVMVGQSAGFKNYNGSSLTLVGTFAGEANNTGNSITALGRDANRSNIDGNYNTSIGWSANLNNTTGVNTIAVTNGGSGYTTATVTISNPPGPTPGVLWETATATATISGGAITGITITNPGAGYSMNYGEKDFHDTIRVTITGDGTGATAEVTETISNVGNTALGYGAGYLDRFGKYNISIGYLSGMNNQLGEDMILMGSNVTTGTLSTTPIINGIAFGKNARVSRSNTMALGGMGADAINVGINTDTARAKLDVVGGDILVHEHTIGRGPGSVATNTVFGTRVMANNTTALGNVAIGYEVAATGTVSTANVMIGYRAANSANYAGTGNIIVGYEAAYLNRANESVAIGLRSMYNQGSNGSVGVGAYTLYNNVRNTSVGRAMNTAIGDYSYYSLTGASSLQTNTGVGAYSGYGITTGAYNTAMGALAMGKGYSGVGTAGASGNYNTSLGYASLYYQNNSVGNIGVGSGAFNSPLFNPSIGYNIGIGFNAGNLFENGNYNVFIGGYSATSHKNVSKHIILSDGEGNVRYTVDSVGNSLFSGTGGHTFQSGTTAQRPTATSGTMRWNTDSTKFEYYDGSNWVSFGSGGSGSGATTIGTIDGVSKSANGGVISGSTLYLQTVDATYPGLMTPAQKARLDSNSYLTIDKTYDSLAWIRNDSTHLTKSLRIQVNGSTVTPTTTDSTLSYNIIASGSGSPAGNFGNIQINRNGSFDTPGSDSLTFASGALTTKGDVTLGGTVGTLNVGNGTTTPQFYGTATSLSIRAKNLSAFTNVIAGAYTANGDISTTGKISVTTGTNKSAGTGTFSSGAATINTNQVTANSLIFIQYTSCSSCGSTYISAKTAGTSFTVTSTNGSDASTFNWWIIN